MRHGTASGARRLGHLAGTMYGAAEVAYTKPAERAPQRLEELGYGELPLWVAKTPASLTDDPKLAGRFRDFQFTVCDAIVSAGAGCVVPLLGDILRMRGLPSSPQANRMDLVDGRVVGLLGA